MKKIVRTMALTILSIAMMAITGCTKTDDPNSNGGNGNNGGGHYNGNYEYVDLGLPSGTLWATFNVGAANPEELGDRFTWEETQPGCYWMDDAATANWGDEWCTPTDIQYRELLDNTTHKFEYGMKGVLLTASNGKSLFFPASNYYYDEEGHFQVEECYWLFPRPFNIEEYGNAFHFYYNSRSSEDRCVLDEQIWSESYYVRPVRRN